MKVYQYLIVIPTLLIGINGYSQDSIVTSDFELWTGVSLEKKLFDKKLSLGLQEQFRFDENSTHLNTFFTELEVNYKVYKGLKLGMAYRFIRNRKNSGTVSEQRFNADLGYKHKIDRFTLDYRFRFQHHDEIGLSREDGDDITKKYRLRIKANYNIKNWKLDPYLSVEGFYAQRDFLVNYIESIDEEKNHSGFEKIRFTLGTSYTIKKFFEIGAYYRIEREFKSYPGTYGMPATYYIGGLNLKFKL